MTKRTEHIIEVVKAVEMEFDRNKGRRSIRPVRIGAVATVAMQRGVAYQTVDDIFIRQLRPQVRSTADFDILLERWLFDNSEDLKNAILEHTQDDNDARAIDRLFFRG